MIDHSDEREGRGMKHTPFFSKKLFENNILIFNDRGCVAGKKGKIQMECDGTAGTQGIPFRETLVFIRRS